MEYSTNNSSSDLIYQNVINQNVSEEVTNNTDPFDWERSSAEPIYNAAYLIIKVAFPILVIIGTIGNGLVIIILNRGGIGTDNLRFFLSFLAVVDTIFLYTSGLKTWIRLVWGFELLHMGTWSCKVGLFLNQLSVTLSAWLLVIITWQRWYTCSQPFRRCCPSEKPRWRYLGTGLLVFVLVAINSYVLITVERVKEPYGYSCVPAKEFDRFIMEIFPNILMVMYSGIPALLLFILNGLLVRVLYQSRRALLTNSGASRESGQTERVRARYNYVTAVLLTLSALWFVLTFPHTIIKLVEHMPENEREHAIQRLINVLMYVLIYINHSANFFIYYALLRGFRREMTRMVKSMLQCLASLQPVCKKRTTSFQATLARDSRGNNSSHTDSFVPLLVHANGMWHRGCDSKVIHANVIQ